MAQRDWAYLAVISTMLFGMLGKQAPRRQLPDYEANRTALDLTCFYPAGIYKHSGSPLHFLVILKKYYIAATGDPFFAAAHHEPWFNAFLYIELFVQFPLAAYLVYNLASAERAARGEVELAGLLFGAVTCMGSVACCFDLWALEEFETKARLLWGTYFPFAVIRELVLSIRQRSAFSNCVIAGALAVDMYLRLLKRIEVANKVKAQ